MDNISSGIQLKKVYSGTMSSIIIIKINTSGCQS